MDSENCTCTCESCLMGEHCCREEYDCQVDDTEYLGLEVIDEDRLSEEFFIIEEEED